MGPRFLIDTNAAIDLLEGKLPAASRYWLDAVVDSQQYAISVITRIELLSPKSTPAQRAPFEELIDIAAVYGLPEEIIRETIRLRRHHRCKLPDAIIAATALVFNLTLITRDVGFRTITGLSVLDPARRGQSAETDLKKALNRKVQGLFSCKTETRLSRSVDTG